jgi:hypothetical protein
LESSWLRVAANRRLLTSCMFAMCAVFVAALAPIVVQAQAALASRVAVLKEAADALGAAGDAIAKLTDGVAHLVQTGDKGWQVVSARRTRSRLVDISARAQNIAGVKQVAVVNSIDEYLSKTHPTAADWKTVTDAIGHVVGDVRNLLDDLNADRSDFVLQKAHATLVETLAARSSILDKLASLPPPLTQKERSGLRNVNSKYKALLSNFRAATTELNKYLETAPPT